MNKRNFQVKFQEMTNSKVVSYFYERRKLYGNMFTVAVKQRESIGQLSGFLLSDFINYNHFFSQIIYYVIASSSSQNSKTHPEIDRQTDRHIHTYTLSWSEMNARLFSLLDCTLLLQSMDLNNLIKYPLSLHYVQSTRLNIEPRDLIKCILYFPGVHNLFGQTDMCTKISSAKQR